jgi:hypothetical protein
MAKPRKPPRLDRHPVRDRDLATRICPGCGCDFRVGKPGPLTRGRQARFCTDRCRSYYHRDRAEGRRKAQA